MYYQLSIFIFQKNHITKTAVLNISKCNLPNASVSIPIGISNLHRRPSLCDIKYWIAFKLTPFFQSPHTPTLSWFKILLQMYRLKKILIFQLTQCIYSIHTSQLQYMNKVASFIHVFVQIIYITTCTYILHNKSVFFIFINTNVL